MSGGARILVVEDEPSLVLTLTDRLTAEGYAVESVEDGAEGFDRALGGTYDLVLLDVMLPGKNGFDVCRDLRRRGVETPILMLTARGQVVDRVVGLKLGADDYLAKPFDFAELSARIEALLRRSRTPIASRSGSYRFGDVEVDFAHGEVRRGSGPIELTALEYKLLVHFVEHRGRVLTREQLLDEVWGYEATPISRTVDVHVAALRQKIEADPKRPAFLLTVHGRGYRFSG
jgi:two-component system alkaline phosphatase synthesis response regulator PhoP